MEFDHTPPEFNDALFSGIARLFPLPAVSLYPGIVLPLHVFEERYLALVEEALDSDGLIGMATLLPGWQADYAGRPPIDPAICLGRIVTYHRQEDGRYNLFLAGMRRARVIQEIEPPVAFRRAEVELLPETSLPTGLQQAIEEIQQRLIVAFRDSLPEGSLPSALERVFEDGAPLGLLSDLAAYTLPLEPKLKQHLLGEPDAMARAQRLIEVLESDDAPRPEDFDFPSDPSEN